MNDDLISRQAAIDAIKGLPTWWADEGGYYGGAQPPMKALLDPTDAVSAIENLPSAQPEIRCKDCKHWAIQVKDVKGDGLGSCEFHKANFVTGEGYCYWAERREDEML